MDTFEGEVFIPATLHKFVYVHADPVNGLDPSGLAITIGGFGALNDFMLASKIGIGIKTKSVAIALTSSCTISRILDEIPGSPGPLVPVYPCMDEDQGSIYFHYTSDLFQGVKLYTGLAVTNNPLFSPEQAKRALGIHGLLPRYMYTIRIKDKELVGGKFVNPSSTADWTEQFPAREWMTTVSLPFTRVVAVVPID